MAFEIERLRKVAEGGEYVSDERICLTAEGELVSCDDPRAARLLVGAGSTIPASEAVKYGLIVEPADEVTPAPPGQDDDATTAESSGQGQDAKRRK